MTEYSSAVLQGSELYPKPQGVSFQYGTAGFRGEATKLPSVLYRCGILAALRSLDSKGAKTGIMVTASHNPERDNGVKFVQPSGEMFTPEWETLATQLAAQQTHQHLLQKIQLIVQNIQTNHNLDNLSQLIPQVCIAHDTRPSANELVQAAISGAEAMGAKVFSWGLCTTPEFHFRVMSANSSPKSESNASEEYVGFFSSGFVELVQDSLKLQKRDCNCVYVDCANGVGGVRLHEFADMLKLQTGLEMKLINTGEGVLNHLVGSDFVEKEMKLPENFAELPSGFRGCSMDGDADRLVYFTSSANGGITLFNGDKIAALAAYFIQSRLQQLKDEVGCDQIKIGVVQTAYANGASTLFLREKLGVQVVCTKTGVKHLHNEALNFDVGIYFEANGHGTVLFTPKYKQLLDQVINSDVGRELMGLYKTVNQVVGDAISGILMVEGILAKLGWSLQEWQNMYTDLPSKQLKVKVQDRSKIVTTPQETQCLQPQGLQQQIDTVVKQFDKGRAFARPSGTEDVVRIYAEAGTKQLADELAIKISQLVFQFAGGVGEPPQI